MPPERHRDPVFIQCEIVPLADVVEAEELHHEVMHRVLAGLDESEAMMARVEMQEAGYEWMRIIVGQTETQRVAIERGHPLDRVRAVDVHHHVAESQWAGAESRDRAARP